jgi:hypothetical protein
MSKAATKPSQATVHDVVEQVRATLDIQWITCIYRDEILAERTRRYELKAQASKIPVEIGYTLLGIELKMGRRRVMMPDWATARYLSVFARIGLEAVAVPYDITRVSSLADELESAWQRMMMLAEHYAQNRSARFTSLVKSQLIWLLRDELTTLGAGQQYPQFSTSTKVYRQRESAASGSE